MLVSKSRNYLFVEVAGSGGSLIRQQLQEVDWFGRFRFARTIYRNLNPLSFRLEPTLPRYAPLVAAQETMASSTFNQLFKFAFVRNPWDRMLDVYQDLNRKHPELLSDHSLDSFKAFVEWMVFESIDSEHDLAMWLHAVRRPQRDYVVGLDGQRLADFIGRFENLVKDFGSVMQRIGFESEAARQLLKSCETIEPTLDYRSEYDDDCADIVAKHFQKDVQAFGYEFDDPALRPIPLLHANPSHIQLESSLAIS